jgi:hypothetical protein
MDPLPDTIETVAGEIEEARRIGGDFLIRDLELAQTILDRARMTADPAALARALEHVAYALISANALLGRLQLPEARRLAIVDQWDRLNTDFQEFKKSHWCGAPPA